MSSRPPGKLLVLPSARAHWHRERMRRRKLKRMVAGMGLVGFLAALLDVALETTDPPPGDEDAAWEEGPFPSAGRSAPDAVEPGPVWLSTLGEAP